MKERTIKRSNKCPKDAFCIDGEMFEFYKKYFEAPGSDEEYILVEN
jgi:hypothetical protein